MAPFAGKPIFVFARGLMPRLGEVLIATSTAATVRDQYALARAGEIDDGCAALIVEHQRADGNLQDQVRAGVAGAAGAFAVAATIGLEFAIVAIAEQRVVVRIRFEIDAAAGRSEEHTSELQSQSNLVCRLLLEKKKKRNCHISLNISNRRFRKIHNSVAPVPGLRKHVYALRMITFRPLKSI